MYHIHVAMSMEYCQEHTGQKKRENDNYNQVFCKLNKFAVFAVLIFHSVVSFSAYLRGQNVF